MQGTAAPDPNRSVSSHPPGESAEIATPTGISLPSIVAQAWGTKTGNQPRDVVAPRLADAARLRFNSVTGREAPSKGPPRELVSRCLDAVQAVGGILAREEDDVFLGRRPAGVHDVGGNVDYRAGLGLDFLLSNPCPKRALQNVDPLLVRVRMRLRA